MTWWAGLDFGKVRDATSFAVLEPAGSRWYLTLLKTWTPERDDCIDALTEVLRILDRDRPDAVHLALDARGLGRRATETALEGELGRRIDLYPTLPSYSERPHRQREDGYTWAGKASLVGNLLRAVDEDRLRLARGLAEGPAFTQELLGLRVLPTRGGVGWTYSHGNQRKHSHDDRISAAALALFVADNSTRTGLTDVLRIRPANRRRTWTTDTPSSE